MIMTGNSFFEESSEQSRVKTVIVSKYFYTWARVTGLRILIFLLGQAGTRMEQNPHLYTSWKRQSRIRICAKG